MSVTLEGFEYQKDLHCKFCLSPQTDFGSEPNPLNLGLKLCLIYLHILSLFLWQKFKFVYLHCSFYQNQILWT